MSQLEGAVWKHFQQGREVLEGPELWKAEGKSESITLAEGGLNPEPIIAGEMHVPLARSVVRMA